MTRIAIDEAVMRCAVAGATSADPDHPQEVLGAAWEAAARFADSRGTARRVNANGPFMRGLVEAARAGAACVRESDDRWYHPAPATPYEETQRLLRARWLETELSKLPPRNRSIVRMALGIDDGPDELPEIGEMHGITAGMVGIVIDRCVSALARTWSSAQFDALMRLEGGPPAAEPDGRIEEAPEPACATPRHRWPKPETPKWTRHRKRGPHKARSVRLAGSTLIISDRRVQRIGEDRYRMSGIDAVLDAAGVARILRNDQPDDDGYRRLRSAVEIHDTFLADEMRSILRGTVMWPTKASERRALPLVEAEASG